MFEHIASQTGKPRISNSIIIYALAHAGTGVIAFAHLIWLELAWTMRTHTHAHAGGCLLARKAASEVVSAADPDAAAAAPIRMWSPPNLH